MNNPDYKFKDQRINTPTRSSQLFCPICLGSEIATFKKLHDDRYGFQGEFEILKCLNCQHKFIFQADLPEEIGDLYTQYYPRQNFDPDSYLPRKKPSGLKAWLKGEAQAFSRVEPGTRVLDIGCGVCENLGYFNDLGCEVYGVEADNNVKAIVEAHGFNVAIGLFDAANYESDFFDFVIMDQVIEHLANPKLVLVEIRRILKGGGKLVFTTPNSEGWGANTFGRKWINWHVPYHRHHFTKKSARVLAKQTGFKVHSLITRTQSAWLNYQFQHLLTYPEDASPSIFWTQGYRRTEGTRSSLLSKPLDYLHKSGVNHLATRLFDLAGVGDSILVELEK